MRLKPNDVAILIDRLMVLFEKPSTISQHQGLTVTSELSVESLSEFLERHGGWQGHPGWRSHRCRDDALDD